MPSHCFASARTPPGRALRPRQGAASHVRGWVVALVAALALPGAGRAETAPPRFTEYPALTPPAVGARNLVVLSPTHLEITVITGGSSKPPPDGPIPPPEVPELAAGDFTVFAAGRKISVTAVGFRRRVAYAPLKQRDLRIGNHVYLQLAEPVPEKENITVTYAGKATLLGQALLHAQADPLRVGPAIHVNQVGYMPDGPKSAMVGYYLGTLGELAPPTAPEFHVLDLRTGQIAHRGRLAPRPDRGMPHGWYRKVVEADFSALKTPGEYRLVIPGYGASYPFFVHEGIPAVFARTYALGLYHQRCGVPNGLPFTRFSHDACHTAPVEIPRSVQALKGFDEAEPGADIFPFVRKGKLDASGGHHDAGDYSKYTINSAGLIHALVFAADNFAGVGALDNLGLPESGDGKGDLLQIAKWEADFLVKLQDEDGAFYFLVYPRDRRYETDVLPDRGDPQLVWPKNTASTGAAVAALVQCASSPKFREHYPDAARRYLEAAQRGWKFLQSAEQRHGRGESYRKFTHYGDQFKDSDEIAWAACELFLATGDAAYEKELFARLDPRDPKTRRWGWRRLTEAYGNAIRSYAFGARSGRLERGKLERMMLLRCEDEIIACAEDWWKAARDSAYGISYPEQTKRVMGGGWFFAADQAFDLATAAQLDYPEKADRRPAFREAVFSNLSYDAGCNPLNVSFITGLGWKRPLEIVHQYAQNDRRAMPVSGVPLASILEGFSWIAVYKAELGANSHPLDGAKTAAYPILDRWGDAFNLQTEFVAPVQARALAASAWLMAQSPLRDQRWRSAAATVAGVPNGVRVNQPVKLRLEAKDIDLSGARIVWEGKEQASAFTPEYTFTPQQPGEQWVEAEAQLPDGRRVFGVATFSATR